MHITIFTPHQHATRITTVRTNGIGGLVTVHTDTVTIVLFASCAQLGLHFRLFWFETSSLLVQTIQKQFQRS